jgi:hypothetical protein
MGREGGGAVIYVASSWRNEYQPEAVTTLRSAGHEVYDFKDSDGFNWREVDPDFDRWDFDGWVRGLEHPAARRGFRRDMDALEAATACVLVLPCGRSAHLEAGFAIGKGKPTVVWVPEFDTPDLMVKMADHVTSKLDVVLDLVEHWASMEALR